MAARTEPAGQGGRPWDWDGFGTGQELSGTLFLAEDGHIG